MMTNDTQQEGGPITPPWPSGSKVADDRWTHWPWSYKSTPALIRDLIGHQFRTVKVGDAVTQEIVPGRVTVVVREDGRIDDIWIDPPLPDR